MISTTIKAIIFLLTCTTLSLVNADTIEIFTHGEVKITGISEAEEKGHTLVYYHMDGIDKIEKALADKATKQYQQQIDALVKKEGIKRLTKMNEFQRNQLLLKQLQSAGLTVDSLSHSVVSQQDREAINHALEDLIYAENNGITKEILPAILFQGQLYKNTTNIAVLFRVATAK